MGSFSKNLDRLPRGACCVLISVKKNCALYEYSLCLHVGGRIWLAQVQPKSKFPLLQFLSLSLFKPKPMAGRAEEGQLASWRVRRTRVDVGR